MNLHHHNQEERLRSIIADVQYKPGWTFEVTRNEHDYMTLWCKWQVPDVETKRMIDLRFTMVINCWQMEQMKTEDVVNYYVSGLLRNAELHEMDEWFKYKGEHVRDPHPELKKTIA